MKKYGFVRVAAATPSIRVADAAANGERVLELYREAAAKGCALAVFPELCLTGSTCADLYTQPALLRGAEEALFGIMSGGATLDTLAVVGLPLAAHGGVVSAAAVIQRGRLLGLIPLRPLAGRPEDEGSLELWGEERPYGSLLFRCEDMPGLTLGVCPQDGPWSRGESLCREGASVIAMPAASHEQAGRAAGRKASLLQYSRGLCCACIYAGAGEGESTTDCVYGGRRLIAEAGELLSEGEAYSTGLTIADIDTELLRGQRLRRGGFGLEGPVVMFSMGDGPKETLRTVGKSPFLPKCPEDAREIFDIQCRGLMKRVEHTRARKLVIGISGGLDSCLALLVAARALDLMDRSRRDVLAITMPCFGTTSRTRGNAEELCRCLGVSFREIPIASAVSAHLKDIGHDMESHDAAYENAQARERTQVLMDIANMENGLVVGTGDLSELALGWATYNGDHMSMYGVNAGAPKTLVRALVAQEAEEAEEPLRSVLLDILDTPVSPELLPSREDEITQATEDLVGPYELHDFFIYHMLVSGFGPAKIYRLACLAFEGEYEEEFIHKWLTAFLKRFFAQQFKRSCLPDGPRLTAASLSPRGGWAMPSDASAALWLNELAEAAPL